MIIRQAKKADLEALYYVSLKTGHLGEDATYLYSDPSMMGHIYSAPYLLFEPELAFVVENNNEVAGFCVGTTDTLDFGVRLEANWWPALRKKYARPAPNTRAAWSADERRSHLIHEPKPTPSPVVEAYPAHLHMNLLPALQGQRLGGRLLECWLNKAKHLGATYVHIGSNANNARAIRFWSNHGFKEISCPRSETTWMGRSLT